MEKKWYLSKTFWVNIIAIIALIGQSYLGEQFLPAEEQAIILGAVNLVLRFVTKEKLTW